MTLKVQFIKEVMPRPKVVGNYEDTNWVGSFPNKGDYFKLDDKLQGGIKMVHWNIAEKTVLLTVMTR